MSIIGTYDIAGVNKWALAQRLKTDKFFMVEHDGQTWYIDNYCARAVPTPDAFVRAKPGSGGLERNTLAYASREDEVLLHDSGLIRRSEYKGKPDITIWRTEYGTEVGVREDFAKMIGPHDLWASAKDPATSALVVRTTAEGTPLAIIMPVKIRKEETK